MTALRRELTANQTRLVVEQVALRHRAAVKFRQADRMFFTRSALEQATDEQVAAYKADRYRDDPRVVDLCCGIGGDMISIAAVSVCRGVDRDPIAQLLATTNCRALGLHVDILRSEVTARILNQGEVWHLDPDRRASGRRVTRIDDYEPGLGCVRQLTQHNPSGAIKLAPATKLLVDDSATELEWVGSRGECRQQIAWLGKLARHAGRTATAIQPDGRVCQLSAAQPMRTIEQVPAPARFVYEVNPTVLAAGLQGELAARNKLAKFSATTGYLTGDELVVDGLLSCFEVFEVLPFDVKRVRALLRQRGISHLEIKHRGLPIQVNELRQQLRLKQGSERAVLIVAGKRGRTVAILARRC